MNLDQFIAVASSLFALAWVVFWACVSIHITKESDGWLKCIGKMTLSFGVVGICGAFGFLVGMTKLFGL